MLPMAFRAGNGLLGAVEAVRQRTMWVAGGGLAVGTQGTKGERATPLPAFLPFSLRLRRFRRERDPPGPRGGEAKATIPQAPRGTHTTFGSMRNVSFPALHQCVRTIYQHAAQKLLTPSSLLGTLLRLNTSTKATASATRTHHMCHARSQLRLGMYLTSRERTDH
jgi:hypothetical protein